MKCRYETLCKKTEQGRDLRTPRMRMHLSHANCISWRLRSSNLQVATLWLPDSLTTFLENVSHLNDMATLIFQRAGWSVHISRTARTFAVSFATALPCREKSRHLAAIASDGIRSTRHHRSLPRPHSARASRHDSARSIFTSTKFYQEQQFQRNATTVRPSSSRLWSSLVTY